jgi:hypothetical protein
LGLGLGLASHAVDQSLVKCQKFLAPRGEGEGEEPFAFLHLHMHFFLAQLITLPLGKPNSNDGQQT